MMHAAQGKEIKMKKLQISEIVKSVRERYGQIAHTESRDVAAPVRRLLWTVGESQSTSSLQVGYSQEEVLTAPAGSDLGLGCGNPQAIAALQPGETVLDLGSGAGFDSFLAAGQVGEPDA